MSMNPFKNLGDLEKYGRQFSQTMNDLYEKINEQTNVINAMLEALDKQELVLKDISKNLEAIKNGLKKP